MSKFKRGKLLIAICLGLMFCALTGFSCVYVGNIKQEGFAHPAEAGLSYYIYDEYDLIEIAEYVGLNNSYTEIHLYADLDMSGLSYVPIGMRVEKDYYGNITKFYGCRPFWGVFYGHGNTIKNITINYNVDYARSGDTNTMFTSALGLFGVLAGECVGVRIEDMVINTDPTKYSDAFFGESCCSGGIAGIVTTDAIIEACVVENLTVNDLNNNTLSTVGGLAGEIHFDYLDNSSQLNVVNCLVDRINTTGIAAEKKRALVYDSGRETIAENCLVRNCDLDYFLNTESFTSSCYNSLQTARMYLDVEGWYVPPTTEFNDGWPHPNIPGGYDWCYDFIQISTYYIDVTGDVSASNFEDYDKYEYEIELPYFYRYYAINDEEEFEFPELILNIADGTFFGTTVTINAPAGKEFSNWKYLGETDLLFDRFYQVEFKSTEITVTFNSVSIDGNTIKPKVSNSSGNSYKVLPNATLSISYNKNNKRVEIKVSTTVIAYYDLSKEALKKYYCKSTTKKLGTQNVQFAPTIELKNYSVNVS